MNTTEVEYKGQIKNFDELWKLATKQFLDYEKIEGIDNWEEYDFSIDCPEDQMKFKDMLQIRFIEELTEASIAMEEPDREHFWEEITDAANFFFSAMIMLGVDYNKLGDPATLLHSGSLIEKTPFETKEYFGYYTYPVIEKVGYLCNLLKNRPWTESNYLVSMYDFDLRLKELWRSFWEYLDRLHIHMNDLCEMFYKKYIVNKHRRNTGY